VIPGDVLSRAFWSKVVDYGQHVFGREGRAFKRVRRTPPRTGEVPCVQSGSEVLLIDSREPTLALTSCSEQVHTEVRSANHRPLDATEERYGDLVRCQVEGGK
jgi:hypothetical protein